MQLWSLFVFRAFEVQIILGLCGGFVELEYINALDLTIYVYMTAKALVFLKNGSCSEVWHYFRENIHFTTCGRLILKQ